MKMLGLIPKPLRKIFKEVTHYACNSPMKKQNKGGDIHLSRLANTRLCHTSDSGSKDF